MTLESTAAVVAAGLVVGAVSALLGVGGGLLMVPFMVLALGESQHVAEGTSLLVIVPTAIAGTIAHVRNRYVSYPHAAALALGGCAGVLGGAAIALRLAPDLLQTVFGLFLATMGARMAWEAARERRSGRR